MLDMTVIGEGARTYGALFSYAVLVSTRVAVAMASMPAPFGTLAPVTTRAVLSVCLAGVMTMVHGLGVPQLPLEGAALLMAGLGEAIVGAVIGLTVRVTLGAAEVAGTVASMSMGLGFASSIDPNYGENSSPPTQLLAFISTLIFFIFGGHHAVLSALSASISLLPPGQVLAVVSHDGVIGLGGRMLARGLQIATPVIGTMMVIQFGLALASRAAPKVHLMYLSFAVSVGAGVVTLFVAAPSVAMAIAQEVRHLPQLLAAALGVY